MGFSMFFVGLGCLMGPPLAGEWVTGNEKQNNLGYVAKTTFQMCAIKDMCAAYSSFCVRAHWRSLVYVFLEAPQKCIVFLGCWITDDVSVYVFTVEVWITNSLRGVIGVPACHPDKKPVKLSWLSYHSVFILVLFASSHQRKIDRWSVSYHWHLFFKSHPASSAVSPHNAMTFPPNIWTWTAFAFQPAPATAAELLWPRWPQFCHTIPPSQRI